MLEDNIIVSTLGNQAGSIIMSSLGCNILAKYDNSHTLSPQVHVCYLLDYDFFNDTNQLKI